MAAPLSAQQVAGYQGQVEVKTKEAIHQGDSVCLRMDIHTQGASVGSDRSLTLTPVIRKGGYAKAFAPILVNGRQRHRLYKRGVDLGKIPLGGYVVVADKGGKRDTSALAYKSALPYEEWMSEAHIDLEEELCGCGEHEMQLSVGRLVERIGAETMPTEYEMRPLPAFIRPQVEKVKKRSTSYDAYLYFPAGSTAIIPTYGRNATVLHGVQSFVGELESDPNLLLSRVSLKGGASIEGNEQHNEQLAGQRAASLLGYLQGLYQLLADKGTVLPGGEDWAYFARLIEEVPELSDYRDELRQISTLPVDADQKEALFRRLDQGHPFVLLKQFVFPRMRRVECRVDYEVRPFDVAEARQVYASHPQHLSLEELFGLANGYKSDDSRFGEVFETAVRLYPNDKTANLNAAASYLQKGDAARAEEYLVKADTMSAEYLNDMGVCFLLKGDYAQAAEWLERAVSKGSAQAIHNKQELQKKLDSLKEMKRNKLENRE
jgi:tetratricopeptide (TPR) repeat protein